MLPKSPALSAGLVLATALCAVASPWHLRTEVVWHDNVTNAERPEDLLPALQWGGELVAGQVRMVEGGHRLLVSGGLRMEVWPRFEGLNLVAPGVALGWEFKPGLGPRRPVLAAGVVGERVAAGESDRHGWGGAARLLGRQRLGTDWLIVAGHEWRRFDARGRAFARTGREWFGRLEWSATSDWTLALEAREREGDVVSYSRPPRPDLEAIGKPIIQVGTFEQAAPWIAYYFQARTRSAAVEVQRHWGRSSLTLRHEHRQTRHAGPGYRNRLIGISVSTRF